MAEPNRSTSVLKSEIKLKSWACPFSPYPNSLNVRLFFFLSPCPMLHPPTNFAVYLLIIFCAPPPTDRQTNITWEISSSAEVKKTWKQHGVNKRAVQIFSYAHLAASAWLSRRAPHCSTEIERDILFRWGWVQTLFSSHFVWSTLRLWVTTAAVCSASTPDRICVFFFFFFFTAITLTQWGKTPVLLTTLMIAHSI